MFIDRIGWVWPYYLLLFIGVAIPSDGQHGVLSLKGASFLVANLSLLFCAWSRRLFHMEHLQVLIIFCWAFVGLCIWFCISVTYDEAPLTAQTDQFKLFITTFSFPLATYYLVREGLITPPQIFKVTFCMSLAYMLLKVSLATLHFLGVIQLWDLLDQLGFRFMRMIIYGGLERLQTSVDILPPFLLFFVLISDSLNVPLKKSFKRVFIVLSLLSTFLSFSRTLLAIYALSWGLYIFTLSGRKMLKIGSGLLALICITTLLIGPETVYKVVEKRFFSYDSTLSDDYRKKQVDALLKDFEQYPLFGKGLGGFATTYVRDPEMPHHYEVQGLAFLMQFGIVGSLILICPFLWMGYRLVQGSFSRFKLAYVALLILWMLAGFTNPFLISLSSGVIYALFMLLTFSNERIEWHGETLKDSSNGDDFEAVSPSPTNPMSLNSFSKKS